MPFPIPLGHKKLRILPLPLHPRRPNHAENVEGKTVPARPPFPLPSITLTKPPPDNRLVLHLLRPQLPALRHPTSHHPALVPLPGPRLKPALGTPLGYHGHEDPSHCG